MTATRGLAAPGTLQATPVPSREQCVQDFAATYAEVWADLWDDIRRRGIEAATETAVNPEKARRYLEGLQAAARAGRAA